MNDKIKKFKISKEIKENIIIVIGLIFFIIFICVFVRIFINMANKEHLEEYMEEQKRIENKTIENQIISENKEKYKEYREKNDGSFNLLVRNILLRGQLPKTIRDKFIIEQIDGGVINFYSRYTYNLSISKDIEPKLGLVLTIILIDVDKENEVEEKLGKYEVIKVIDDKEVLAVIPKDVEYFEDDKVSVSNYNTLLSYKDDIINSVIITKEYELSGDTGNGVVDDYILNH